MSKTVLRVLSEIEPGTDFTLSDDYVRDNLLDSLGVITLIELLESEFDIEIEGVDIIYENFKNLDAIIAMLEKYR